MLLYLGHLNCYNRDYWKETTEGNGIKLEINGTLNHKVIMVVKKETLNGDEPFFS